MLPVEINLFLHRKLDKCRDYKAGIKACCPFHIEHTPSFFVFYSDKMNGWFYKCHGCPASGSLHGLMKKLKGPIEFTVKPEVIFNAKNTEQSEVFRTDTTRGLPDIYDYFESRGISRQVATSFGFKTIFGQNPSVLFPVYFQHTYVGHVRRLLDPAFKYRYQLEDGSDFSAALWGFDRLDLNRPVFITEGIIDAAVIWTHGQQATALITGKKWEGKTDFLRMLEYPICLPDNGDPHSIDSFLTMSMKIGGSMAYLPPNIKDVSDFYSEYGSERLIEWLSIISPNLED